VKKLLLLSLFCLVPYQFADAKIWSARTASNKVPQKARRLTGTYRNRRGEFKIQALGVNRLHVQFNGTYEYRVNRELMANTGTADGMVTLNGNTATFVPPDTQGCSISLTFTGQKLIARQTGADADCGFGQNVTADGTYIKRSSRPPKFEER